MTYILSGLGVLGDLNGSIYEVCTIQKKLLSCMITHFARNMEIVGTKYGNGGLLNKKYACFHLARSTIGIE